MTADARGIALGERIERLALGPEKIDRQALTRLARPLLSVMGYRPKVATASLEALAGELVASRGKASERSLARALRELEDNVTSVERASIVSGRPLVAYAAWLRRVWEFVARAERASRAASAPGDDGAVARVERTELLPPLSFARPRAEDDAIYVETAAPVGEDGARSLDLELALVDHLLDAARTERRLLARRRRLLIAARQVMLEAAAALPLHRAGVASRVAFVAREIAWMDRLEAAGLDADVALVHQARHAALRGDRARLHASLRALESMGDGVIADVAARALSAEVFHGAIDARASVARSAAESFGEDVLAAIAEGYARGRRASEVRMNETRTEALRRSELVKLAYLEGEEQSLACALAVDGAFELGGAMTPVRVIEESRRLRTVRHPTPSMLLVPAREPADLRDAVIHDPRSMLLDLATGRLLTRRFVREEVARTERIRMRSEVRVYVLDGSGSMMGPRARMRDAVLLAELATAKRRAEERVEMRSVLFYRYFTHDVGPVVRVDTPEAIGRAIVEVCAAVHDGGTDIQAALMASFATVASAKADDPELHRAQIVLVTDGAASVDEAAIVAAREGLGDLPIGVSVIALGAENPALAALVARQRARGERAFYHFVDDEHLESIARGEAVGPPLHLPPAPPGEDARVVAAALERELGPLLDELERLTEARDGQALATLDAPDLVSESEARREVGLGDGPTDGERARAEAFYRDQRAVQRRYERWFSAAGAPPDDVDEEDAESVFVALTAIAEVLRVVGGGELDRRADAIALLERLLPDAQLTPARYAAVLAARSERIEAALASLHAAVTNAQEGP